MGNVKGLHDLSNLITYNRYANSVIYQQFETHTYLSPQLVCELALWGETKKIESDAVESLFVAQLSIEMRNLTEKLIADVEDGLDDDIAETLTIVASMEIISKEIETRIMDVSNGNS